MPCVLQQQQQHLVRMEKIRDSLLVWQDSQHGKLPYHPGYYTDEP